MGKYNNNKFIYYLKGVVIYMMPGLYYRIKLKKKLATIKKYDQNYIFDRVNYYNKLNQSVQLPENAIKISEFKRGKSQNTYFFDLYKYICYFPKDYKFLKIFGDVVTIPTAPSIIKVRPLIGDNKNAIILKLNKIRHFIFVNDKKSFIEKKDMLVGRAGVYQPQRIRFWEMYFNHPMCNLGQTNNSKEHPEWTVKPMSKDEQMDYKFILCLEGNDVASNLKWVMSSNSLAVMPPPAYETWFMEGSLIPNYHYIAIKEDFSNLEERLKYYVNHQDEALQIIGNAHAYVEQFKNSKREDLISLLTLQKYFEKTNNI